MWAVMLRSKKYDDELRQWDKQSAQWLNTQLEVRLTLQPQLWPFHPLTPRQPNIRFFHSAPILENVRSRFWIPMCSSTPLPVLPTIHLSKSTENCNGYKSSGNLHNVSGLAFIRQSFTFKDGTISMNDLKAGVDLCASKVMQHEL